jgi:hypothetical protein
MEAFDIREIHADANNPHKQWIYGTFLCGPELTTDVWNAQEHAYSIDKFNKYRELDKRASRVCQSMEHMNWKKFTRSPLPPWL